MTTFFVITSIIAAIGALYFWGVSLCHCERAEALSRQRNSLAMENHKLRSALSKEQREKLEAGR